MSIIFDPVIGILIFEITVVLFYLDEIPDFIEKFSKWLQYIDHLLNLFEKQ